MKIKKHKTRKTIGTILLAIFLILLLGVGWRVYGGLKNSIWDGQNRLNLVLNMDPVSLVSFDPHTQTIDFLIIPNGTYIETAEGYGPYRIEKIFPLGELEGRGMELLSKSLQSYFGLPIDGWLMVNGNQPEASGKQLLISLIKLTIKNKSLTNLSRWDLIRLWLMTNRTRGHKIETVDLGETTVAEEFNLPDGTQAKRIDEERISRIISQLFTDYRLRQESLAIAVMNAGGETGLAAKAANLITNIGGRVVEVGDWTEKLEHCQIKTTSVGTKSYTTWKLGKVFGCQFGEELEEDSRWDLLIILTLPRQ